MNNTICDICRKEFEQEVLINIDASQLNEDLLEDYNDFEGMVCECCFDKIAIKSKENRNE